MQDLLKDCRTPWFNVHSIFDELPWSPDACRVYLHLSRRAGQQASAWPSYQSIGKTCFRRAIAAGTLSPESARRKAIRAVDELIELGLVSKDQRQGSGGNQSNLYTLTHCDKWNLEGVTSNHPPSDVTSPLLVTSNHPPSDVTSPKGIPSEGSPLEGNPSERSSSSADRDRNLGENPPKKIEPFPVFDSRKTVRRIEHVQTIPRWDINAPWADDEERKRFDDWLRVKYAAKNDPPRYAASIVGKVAKGEPSVDWEDFCTKPQAAISQSREAEVLKEWGDRQDWENFPLLAEWSDRCESLGWLEFCNLGGRYSAHHYFSDWWRFRGVS